MNLHRCLDDILGQRSSVTVLRYLVLHREEMSGRGIATALAMNPWTCHLALRGLVDHGVVTVRVIGNVHLFQLSEQSYMVERVLAPLFAAEDATYEEALCELVAGLPDSVVAVLMSQGGGHVGDTAGSGLELLVLVARAGDWAGAKRFWEQKAQSFSLRFGVALSPMVLAVDEFRRRYHARDPRLRTLAESARPLYGVSLRDLVAGEG